MNGARPPKLKIPADLTEEVFDRKNKAYGAYKLRKSSPTDLMKAFVLTIGTLFFFIMVLLLIGSDEPEQFQIAEIEPVTIDTNQVIVFHPRIVPNKRIKPVKFEEIKGADDLDENDSTKTKTKNDKKDDQSSEIKREDEVQKSSKQIWTGGKDPVPINLEDVASVIGYPKELKTRKVEGNVLVSILVDKNGNYVKHEIRESSHVEFSKACELQIPNLQFQPARKEGERVRSYVTIPFRFRMDSE